MTIDEIIEEQPPEEPEDTGPGELLSRKREALGLGIRQVAEDLHITMHYVKALESNAFDKLPGDVFVRGYIRAYANLLHLDPQIIINVYDDYTNQGRITEEHAYQVLSRRHDRNLPWVLISGVAFVVIAVGLWFFSAGDSESSGSTAVQRNSSATAGNGAAATLENVGSRLASDPVTLVDTPAPVPESVELSEPAAQVAEPVPVDGLSAEPDASAVPAEMPVEEVPAALTEPAVTEPAVEAQASAADERVISIDAGGTDVVQMVFKGDSSVQVDDGTDKQIYRDNRGAGDVLRISGSAPFDILLGEAGSVELSLNGAPVDFSASIRIDNSARLTIGL